MLLKPGGIGNYQCLRLDEADGEVLVADAERLAEVAEGATLVCIAPAAAVSLRKVRFDSHERKILRQTIPYALEEDLVDDVDDIHFALGTPTEDRVPLALVKREPLQAWLHELREQALDVQQLIPELQLLPLVNKGWTLLVADGQWLLRYCESEGFAMEADNARLAMQLLLDEADELPESLQLYCPSEQQSAVVQQLPEMLRGIVQWHGDDYWQLIAAGYRQQSATRAGLINLLQGEFALNLPWQKWWKHWRLVAVLLVAAIMVHLLATFTRMQVLEARNIELRTEIETTYRSVVPRGAVMDPERQLRRLLNTLKGSNSEGFIVLFDPVGRELSSIQGLSLQSLNYTEKQAEIRLTVLANSFDDVETVRARLEKRGLNAALEGSNAEGDKTRARLRIRK
jgi:type II secretion system protein L